MPTYRYSEPTEASTPQLDVVPFGKYKGLPVETMLADQNYLEWMTTQPGIMAMLQSKHPAVFNIITIGTPATTDTPEHNKLSSLFLDERFQYAFIEACLEKSVQDVSRELSAKVDKETSESVRASLAPAGNEVQRTKERLQEAIDKVAADNALDPRVQYEKEFWLHAEETKRRKISNADARAWHQQEIKDFPVYQEWIEGKFGYNCTSWAYTAKQHREIVLELQEYLNKYEARLQSLIDWKLSPAPATPPKVYTQFECGYDLVLVATWRISSFKFLHFDDRTNGEYEDGHCGHWTTNQASEHRQVKYKIELKPKLGDDFPGVLRQMKRTESDTLVIGSFNSRGCTLEQVRRIFATNDIKIVTLQEIQIILNAAQV